MTTLFVSPHFDDVAWSCVAHVLEARRRGKGRVLVATVFGHGQSLRQQEDARAMALLGCEPLSLPFLDAPERLGLAPTFGALLLARYPREPADRAALVEALQDLVSREEITHLVLPLGIGGHVDHRLVHSTQDAWASFSLTLSFYEDQPYAQVSGALAARLVQIGARVEGPASAALALASATEAEASARRSFSGLLSSPPDPAELADLAALATTLASPALDPAPGTSVGLLRPHTLPTDADLSARVLGCYASQLSLWFPTPEHLRAFTRARSWETFWRRP